ncbi:MAG: glycosyltransferase family 4 protein [Nanoarchaeota archaeon]
MRTIKVLMLGWEFPPKNTGGLGTACYGLTKGLVKNNTEITLILPYDIDNTIEKLKILSTSDIKVEWVKTILSPYMTYNDYNTRRLKYKSQIYGKDLAEEVERYTRNAIEMSKSEDFDVVHCHDWMTFKAGMGIKEFSKKSLIVHIHSTEFDRTGGNGANQYVYDIEKAGMYSSDYIIAVSNYTKNMIIRHYGIPPEKIFVVHNAVWHNNNSAKENGRLLRKNHKIVLFLGRITLQKGPDYFMYSAKKALDIEPNLLFVIAGKGDMEQYIIEKSAELGIADKVIFTGFLTESEVNSVYRMADVYVMPSVSEPFGITTLEAMNNGTPVIISRQSGVSEIVNHCLKVDFWDINQIASKIISVVRYNELKECLVENSSNEVMRFSWDTSAKRCIEVYQKCL